MAQGRRKLEWAQTADVLAMLFNGMFRPTEAKLGRDFNPTALPDSEPQEVIEVPLSALRAAFVRN